MIYSRKITLALKLNPTMFQVVNTKAIGPFNTLFGPSGQAVLTLSSKTAEMAAILPPLLGSSANATSVNFQDLVLKHLKNSVIDIPASGYELETGWEFQLNDPIKKAKIVEYIKSNKIDDTLADKQLEKALFDEMLFGSKARVHEEELYLYMTPIKPQDYILWRLALLTSTVANKPEDVDRSTNIRFYLHSEEDVKRIKEAKTKKVVNTALKLAQLLAGDEASNKRIRNMLICDNPVKTLQIVNMDNNSIYNAIAEVSANTPERFIDLFDNDGIEALAEVHKLMAAQIITKDGDNIFDTNHPERILGSTIEGVIAFLASPDNAEYKKQLFSAYKASVFNA